MSSSVFPVPFSGIQETLIDAKGDLIAGNAADTPVRVAVGSNNTVLTADSSVTGGVKWAAPAESGWTNLVASTAFGAVASVTMSSINQTYRDLRLIITDWSSATGGGVQIAFNDTGTSYGGLDVNYTGTFTVARTNNGRGYFRMGDSLYSTAVGSYVIELPSYSTTGNRKFGYGVFSGQDGGSGADAAGWFNFYKTSNSATTSIILSSSGGNFDSGTYELWGRK